MTAAPPKGSFTTSVSPAKTAGGTGLPRVVLMRPDDVTDVKTAADHAGRDDKTIRRWCRRFGIGRQAGRGAPLEISRIALEMVMHGDREALELLRSGNRTHPDVVIYFDFVGISP